MPTALSVVLSLFALFLIRLFLELRRVSRNVGNLSGPFFLFIPDSLAGWLIAQVVPRIPYLTPGANWKLSQKYEMFAAAGQGAATLIAPFPQPKCVVQLADAAAIKEVTTFHAKYSKPMASYEVLAVLGPNIVASEGAQWKKYRKATAPAFSERNYKLVWDETIRIMMDLVDNVWCDKSEIVVDHFLEITLPIALLVIGTAGFGHRVTWTSDLIVPPGHQMTFKDALNTLSTNVFWYIILPSWTRNLTKHTKKTHLAFIEMKRYMVEMVEARRNGDKEEHYDLFSGLLDAACDESDNGAALSDEELIGNMFMYLLVGHETTAHALCYSFLLLALYPEEQERMYDQIKGVTSSLDGMPNHEDMGRLTYCLAVLYETLRLFPPVVTIPKIATEDTTLTVSNNDGGKTTFPVPSGTEIFLHVPGLHHNPRYWKDPHKFIPERFLGDWPKDAFIPFSQGARACLGRRFFETESIAVIAMMVSKYRIEVKEEPEFSGETFEERYARLTASDQGLTTTPLRVPLVFRKRS